MIHRVTFSCYKSEKDYLSGEFLSFNFSFSDLCYIPKYICWKRNPIFSKNSLEQWITRLELNSHFYNKSIIIFRHFVIIIHYYWNMSKLLFKESLKLQILSSALILYIFSRKPFICVEPTRKPWPDPGLTNHSIRWP